MTMPPSPNVKWLERRLLLVAGCIQLPATAVLIVIPMLIDQSYPIAWIVVALLMTIELFLLIRVAAFTHRRRQEKWARMHPSRTRRQW